MLLAAVVIVALKEGAAKQGPVAFQTVAAREYTVIARWHHAPAMAIEIGEDARRRLETDPLVRRVDDDAGGSGSLAQSVPLIGADKVHALGYTGKGVTVALLDTGVDERHPDLAGRIVDEQCFCRNADGTGCCPNGQTTQSGAGAAADDHGHGSNVAGIIGSRGVVSSVGVAPGVNFVVVKVLDRNNRFSSIGQVITALDWLVDTHPEVRAVNISLGTDALFPGYCDTAAAYTIALAAETEALRARGALAFVSTGNDASSTSMEAPACVQAAVSVGAVYDANVGVEAVFGCTDSATTADQIACFSNSNSTLDLLAPGAQITSDWLGGGTSTFYGTSQAAPHATGSAAVLIEVQPSLTADEIESILKSSGKFIADPRNGVVTPRVNVFAAVENVIKPPPPRGTGR